MTAREHAERQAKAVRYAERVRWEERCRAFDVLEFKALDAEEPVAQALYEAAAEIMRHKP